MSTLFDLVVDLALMLGGFKSAATSGDTLTLYDLANQEPSDYWNGGLLIHIAGPRITTWESPTDWNLTTHALVINSGAAITTDTEYILLHKKYQIGDLKRAINVCLDRQKQIAIDVSMTADGSEVVDLPTGVSEVQTIYLGNDDDGWNGPINYWRETPEGQLIFQGIPPDDDTLRLVYKKKHDHLDVYADAIDPSIDYDQLKADTYAEIARQFWLLNPSSEGAKDALALANQAAKEKKQPTKDKDPKYMVWE